MSSIFDWKMHRPFPVENCITFAWSSNERLTAAFELRARKVEIFQIKRKTKAVFLFI